MAQRYSAPLWGLGGALLAMAIIFSTLRLNPGQRPVTQGDIDTAVRESLEKEPLPSQAANTALDSNDNLPDDNPPPGADTALAMRW